MKKFLNKKGFTLVELMIVVVIVGILAAVAIPKFIVAQHKAKASEAPTVVTQIYNAEGVRQAEQGAYLAVTDQGDFSNIGVNVPDSKFFSYGVPSADRSSFTAQGYVEKGFGEAEQGHLLTINEEGKKSGTGTWWSLYIPSWTNG